MKHRDISSLKVSAALVLLKMVICKEKKNSIKKKKERDGRKRIPVRKNPDSGYGLQPGRDKATSKCRRGFVKLLPFPFQQVRKPQDTETVQ